MLFKPVFLWNTGAIQILLVQEFITIMSSSKKDKTADLIHEWMKESYVLWMNDGF